MQQLSLFSDEARPFDPVTLLRNGAALVLSVSGGKDSDAMCHHLLDLRQTEGWSGDVSMVYADLGRAEWHNTPDYVHGLARRELAKANGAIWIDSGNHFNTGQVVVGNTSDPETAMRYIDGTGRTADTPTSPMPNCCFRRCSNPNRK